MKLVMQIMKKPKLQGSQIRNHTLQEHFVNPRTYIFSLECQTIIVKHLLINREPVWQNASIITKYKRLKHNGKYRVNWKFSVGKRRQRTGFYLPYICQSACMRYFLHILKNCLELWRSLKAYAHWCLLHVII